MKADIKNIGFSVKSDGSVSFFAELEKSSADQKKRIEQAREDKKAQKKKDEKEAKAKSWWKERFCDVVLKYFTHNKGYE